MGVNSGSTCSELKVKSQTQFTPNYPGILVEIACRISPEAMIYSEIYHEWPQAIHGRFHREDPTFEI